MNNANLSGSVWYPEKMVENTRDSVHYRGYCTTRFHAENENTIAQNIVRLYLSPHKTYPDTILDKYIEEGEAEYKQKLHPKQKAAIKMFCKNMVAVLTGGPGTGKTTVLKLTVYVLRKLMPKTEIAFAAPTAKAAKVISAATGEQAFTLHKRLALSYDKEDPDFFSGDILFVDESSMLDNALASKLTRALVSGKRLFFVGDTAQLPSVGEGAVLRDIINSRCIPVTQLTKTFRQSSDSGLLENISLIREGKFLVPKDDFILISEDQKKEQDIIEDMVSCYEKECLRWGKENVCMILPYRKKGICSDLLNRIIQERTNNRPGLQIETPDGEICFRLGDFVMQLTNRAECSNGDTGKVVAVTDYSITVEYEDSCVQYAIDELQQLTLAYAITVHKSQGSEYASVIMGVFNSHENMLAKNLLYTGITRAKKKCTLFYQTKALQKAISTETSADRKTFLAEKIIYAREQIKMRYGI